MTDSGLMRAYYNYPQAPGKYEDAVLKGTNVLDEVAKQRYAEDGYSGYACGVPLIPFAYLVSTYCIIEGVIILIEDPDLNLAGFDKSETGYLQVVAWGNIVFALLGALGTWFGHNILPMGWRHTSKMHSTLAMLGAGLFLAWRALVCLSFAPWAGILLAFSPTNDKVWAYVLVCCYIAFSILLVYVLAMAFRQTVCDSKLFQQHLNAQALEERQRLLLNAHNYRRRREDGEADARHADGDGMHDHEVEPELFSVFPLAETVTLYALVIAIACLWNFIHLCFSGHTSGGWVFFSKTPEVSSTFWLEVFLWPISFVCALAGMAGALSFCGSGIESSGGQLFLDEGTSSSAVLLFLIQSMLRFGLLFAVTGMAFIEKDTCGFYINGLSKLAYRSYWSPMNGMVHCHGWEYLLLAGALVCCILDGYLIWGTFQLWHHARDWKFVEIPINGKYASLEDNGIRDL